MNDLQIKNKIVEIGRRMYERGFVSANDGNISARADDGNIWITPTGVSKGDLVPEILLKTDPDGNIIEGTSRPSSETGMHLRLYRENRDIMAAVHTHAPCSTSFAVAKIPLDVPCYPEALVLLGEVPVTEYAQPGTPAVADSVAPYCRTHCAVLLAHHGPLTWGRNPEEAWHRMESVEGYAKILLITRYILKSDSVLNEEQINRLKSINI